MNALNDTVRYGAAIDYGSPATPDVDLTPHMMRIIRRALRPGGGGTPLDRAIRSPVAPTTRYTTQVKSGVLRSGKSSSISWPSMGIPKQN